MKKLTFTLMILSISATLVACQNSKDFTSTEIEPTNATSAVSIDIPTAPVPLAEPDVSSIFLQKRDFEYRIEGYTIETSPEIDKMKLQKYEDSKQAYDEAINDYHKKCELFENGEISEEELFEEYGEFLNGPCKNFWEIVDEIDEITG